MRPEITAENYEQERQALLEANGNLRAVILREPEIRVDRILWRLKEDFRKQFGTSVYDMVLLTNEEIRKTELYRFCSLLPKGADLHVHDMTLLPVPELIDFLMTCPEICIRSDGISADLIRVPENDPVPEGYTRFSSAMRTGIYTRQSLIRLWTVVGAKDSGLSVWDYFELLFDRHAVLSGCPEFAIRYYDRAFRSYCNHHIQHVEIHLMLTDGMDDSEAYLKAVRQAYYNVKKDYPAFTVRIIGAGVKADNENIELTRKCFLNTSYVQEIIKDESDPDHVRDFVIGFDLVNEEDSSLPLHAFAPMLLKVKRLYPGMRLFIHGGESLDARNENLIDAYLLGASRVGHGMNLYRYPDLHRRFIESEICLEVCPVSNQRLGYTPDIRSHPAAQYLRTGAALSLCSDDPVYMENEALTDDFFAAVSAWDLNLADIKQLAINSIVYSGLDDDDKTKALKNYGTAWNEFVSLMLHETDIRPVSE